MEGAVDDSCRCDKPKPGVVANPYAATCASMICPDGTHCDPTTGVCVGGTPNNPLFLPGVRPDPIPMPFDGNIAIERGIQAGGLRLSTRLPVGGAGPPSTNR